MKLFITLGLGLLLLTTTSFTHRDLDKRACLILHKGTFLYTGSKGVIEVVIKGSHHIEHHNAGKHLIKSKIEWMNACECNLTLKKITLPDFPHEAGEVMNLKVEKVSGNEIFFTSTIGGESSKGKMIKVN